MSQARLACRAFQCRPGNGQVTPLLSPAPDQSFRAGFGVPPSGDLSVPCVAGPLTCVPPLPLCATAFWELAGEAGGVFGCVRVEFGGMGLDGGSVGGEDDRHLGQ